MKDNEIKHTHNGLSPSYLKPRDHSLESENNKKIIRARADFLACRSPGGTKKTAGCHYLLFFLNSEKFALPMSCISEIKKIKKYSPVPGSPEYLLGIMMHNEEFFGLVDLKKILKIEADETDSEKKYYIALKEGHICLQVDRIDGITVIHKNIIDQNSVSGTGSFSEYIVSVIPGDFCVLSCDEIIKGAANSKSGGLQ